MLIKSLITKEDIYSKILLFFIVIVDLNLSADHVRWIDFKVGSVVCWLWLVNEIKSFF